MKKKRNKAYNPNKSLKVHKLTMHWEAQEKDRRVALWRWSNGYGDHDLISMSMFLDIHKGDLGIALRKHLIPEKQCFHILCQIHARNDDSGETVDVEYELSIPERMTLWQFLDSYDERYPDDVFYISHGHGLKTKWEGFNVEIERYLETVGDDDFKMITNHCTLTCHSACNNLADEAELRAIKMVHLKQLGVGA